jgi:putative transposase
VLQTGHVTNSQHSDDNALDESVIGLYKTKAIYRFGPWRNCEHVEFETLDWVDWSNNRWLLEPIGNIPPAEFEEIYYQSQEIPAMEWSSEDHRVRCWRWKEI